MQVSGQPSHSDMELDENLDQTILNAFDYLVRCDWSAGGDQMIPITNVLARAEKVIDSM